MEKPEAIITISVGADSVKAPSANHVAQKIVDDLDADGFEVTARVEAANPPAIHTIEPTRVVKAREDSAEKARQKRQGAAA